MSNDLWLHQKVGVEQFSKQGGCFGFFFDPGCGKTRTAIECVRKIYNVEGKLLPTIIISPLITLENWRREFIKYSKVKPEDIIILHGTPHQKTKLIASIKHNPNKIIILNWEGLLSDQVMELLLSFEKHILIGDELHSIKNPTSKRTKKALVLAKQAKYRIGLTGTPVLNSSQDLWSQLFFIDLGKRLGDKFHWFKAKYFYDKNAGMPSHIHFPNWVPQHGSNEHIKELISDVTMSVKKEDCLDLPPLVRKEIYVQMSSRQKHAYEQMREDFVTYLNDTACVANLAITKALRLQQILSGFMPMDSGEIVTFSDCPRSEVLSELLTTLTPNHKVIVWAAFRENHNAIRRLCETLKIKYVMLTGEQDKKEKDKTMEDFENDPDVRVCIGNQSVGIGVNLVSSSVSIYYSKGFNLAHDIQSEARNYRAGSECHTSITRYDLVCPSTLDEQVNEALRNKKEIGAQLLKEFSVDL